jgi:flagellar biosynthetic protein FlhB
VANDQEKTEYLSQKRMEEAREKGELPQSRELSTFVVFAIFIAYFSLARLAWFDHMGSVAGDLLRFDSHLGLDRDNLIEFMFVPICRTLLIVAPLFAVILLVSPLVHLCQTRFNIAKNKLAPDWTRLDPAKGMRRMVSRRQIIEGLKAAAKIALFAWLAFCAVQAHMDEIRALATVDLRQQLAILLDVALAIAIRVAILMAILAVADFGYQWWEFHNRMRMTRQEMKDELKEREGNPLVRQRQRSLQMQATRQRMMGEVGKASVVVTNPTHYAVALRYDPAKAPAPWVVAKGSQGLALRIRHLARKAGVPVVENRPLARLLYRKCRVGRMIPGEFYRAVAEVLAFVYLMKQRRGRPAGRRVRPRWV